MSAKCRQNYIADPDTNAQCDPLLEQLPHGLPSHPASHPLTYIAFFDGVVVPHQLGQGIQESPKSCHLVPPLCCIILRLGLGLRPPSLILFALHPLQVGGRGRDGPMAQEGALVRDYLDKSTRPIPLPGSWVGFR